MIDPVYERSGIRVYQGDCREVVAELAAQGEQFSAVVTDPPYGLGKEPDMVEVLTHWLAGDDYHATGGGFMGRSWDAFVPGPATWKLIAATMKPGAHLAAFSGTRTYDLMGIAIRLAGFEIRDTLQWLYGSGFPKSLDVSKAIDKMAGAEREVVGSKVTGRANAPRSEGRNHVDCGGGQMIIDITAPATGAARDWQGWGTALKPAYEPIILARRPLIGTVAANVLAHGTGGINIDACRVAGGMDDTPESWAKKGAGGKAGANGYAGQFSQGMKDAYARGDIPLPSGRWPPNVLLDETAAAQLDQMSGERKGRVGMTKHGSGTNSVYGTYARSDQSLVTDGYPDTGGASRFFPVLPIDDPNTLRFCALCEQPYAPKHSTMKARHRSATCNDASIAETSSSQSESPNGSAPDNAQARQPLNGGGSGARSNTPARTVESGSPSTPGTIESTAPTSAAAPLEELLVPRVRSAANLCDSCVIATAQSLARTLQGQPPVSPPGLDSMPRSTASILTRSLASFAEPMVNTGIIPTTASLSILFGSVQRAISESTSKASAAQNYESAQTRWIYTPKASRRERNAGLDGLPERESRGNYGDGIQDNRPHTREGYQYHTTVQNHHPTVKPLALMRWLLTLVTPPGGMVLDPFAGSGTTGVAAVQLGIPCVLIEQETEYLSIIAGRIDHALDARAGAELPLFAGVAD